MEKLGFQTGFVELLMTGVSSVKYKVRFNSHETDMFTLLGEFGTETPSLHICSLYVQNVCLVCCSMKKKLVAWMGLECV